MAGCEIANGSASSLTVAAPSASRARIPRRVESARAAKVRSSDASGFTDSYLAHPLYNVKLILNAAAATEQRQACERQRGSLAGDVRRAGGSGSVTAAASSRGLSMAA